MNPALPPLAAVPLAAALVAWRTRDAPAGRLRAIAEAVALFAALALVLLAPPLAVSDGVPSGAALLREVPPFRVAGEPPPRTVNPELGDLPFQVEPRLLFVRDELRAGRLPFWNPASFGGYPVWAAAQSAPLSPLTWLFAALPLELACFALPFVRFLVAGLGAWLLARELGLGRWPALLAGALFEICGRLVAFALFPLGGAIALVPWVLLATERVARGRRGGALLAVASALAWTSGHPETAAFAMTGSLLWLLLAGPSARAFGRWVAGALAGLLAAGAAVVPFALLLPDLARYRAAAAAALPLRDTAKVLARFLVPGAWGDPGHGVYFGALPYVPTLLYCGAFALPLAAVALVTIRRDVGARRLAVFGATFLVLALAPPGIHDLFQLLPGLRHGIAHYFLPLALVSLALLAALGLEKLAAAPGALLAGAALASAVIGAAAWALLGERWREHGLAATNLGQIALVIAVPLLLLAARRGLRHLSQRLVVPALVLLASGELALRHRSEIPLSRSADLRATTPAIAALQSRAGRFAAASSVLPPNVASIHGLRDLRGADAATPASVAVALGQAASGIDVVTPALARNLDRWSVATWMTPPEAAAPEPDSALLYDGADARLFSRPRALPEVRIEDAAAGDTAELVERSPGRSAIAWSALRAGVVVVAIAFDPGWRATIDGTPVAIDGSDPLLLRIPVGPGSGRLELRYLPVGIFAGAAASIAGLALVAALAFAERRLPASACLAGEATGTIQSPSTGIGKESGSAR